MCAGPIHNKRCTNLDTPGRTGVLRFAATQPGHCCWCLCFSTCEESATAPGLRVGKRVEAEKVNQWRLDKLSVGQRTHKERDFCLHNSSIPASLGIKLQWESTLESWTQSASFMNSLLWVTSNKLGELFKWEIDLHWIGLSDTPARRQLSKLNPFSDSIWIFCLNIDVELCGSVWAALPGGDKQEGESRPGRT